MTATTPATQRSSTGSLWALRVLGALLLLAIAGIHVYLWQQGYRNIEMIGPAFLAQSVIAVGGAALLFLTRGRLLAVAAVLGALFALGSLGALLVSTFVGLFGFRESMAADLWWETIWVEVAAAVVLGALAALANRRGRCWRGRDAETTPSRSTELSPSTRRRRRTRRPEGRTPAGAPTPAPREHRPGGPCRRPPTPPRSARRSRSC